MTTTKLTGGLGNQMFQYATGLSAALKTNEELFLDLTYYTQQPSKDTLRTFELTPFNITHTKTNIITETIWDKIKRKIKNRLMSGHQFLYDKNFFEKENLIGYFQNEKYFTSIRNTILKEFSLKIESPQFKETKEYIKKTKTVSLHIRRGDYIENPHASKHHGVLPFSYYKKAYDTISTKIGSDFTLLIFTDDSKWVEKNITLHEETHTISGNELTSAEELILMSLCTHNIIANSSFSWWGAWLNQNPDKIVIAPKQWTRNKTSNELDVLPESWIRL